MEKLLVVVDMQNDFVDGSLGTPEAVGNVENVVAKIKNHSGPVVYTRDTHPDNYLETQEGKNLPVVHCVKGTTGWELNPAVQETVNGRKIFDKPTFGSVELAHYVSKLFQTNKIREVELIGLCTDICVISNAMVLKAAFPEVPITVDSACSAGVTVESHNTALNAMRAVQIEIV